jgi:uncharacterized membrane protein
MSMSAKYAMQKRRAMYDGGAVTPASDAAKKAAESMRKAFRFAKGGDVSCEACKGGVCMAHGGLVDRVMAKRAGETPDAAPNEFDELELEPAPEDDSTAGNEIGDDTVHDEERDLVSRIMRKRKTA